MFAGYQKLLDEAKKIATDALKTASKRAIQKTAETTGDLICNEIANKIKCYSTYNNSKIDSQTEENQ